MKQKKVTFSEGICKTFYKQEINSMIVKIKRKNIYPHTQTLKIFLYLWKHKKKCISVKIISYFFYASYLFIVIATIEE